jgi:hypothetical protein
VALLGRGRHLGHVLAGQGLELQLLEEGVRGGTVHALALQGLEVELDGGVRSQGDEPLRQERLLAVGPKPLAIRLALDLARVFEDLLHRSVRPHEVPRPLVADPGHARDVVDRVPHEGEHVHDALGGHAPLRLDRGPVVPGRSRPLPAGVEDEHVVGHELQQVLVGRDDDDLEPLVHRLPGQGGDRVVGLVAGDLGHGEPKGLAHPPHPGDLHRQVVVHLRTVRLVFLVFLVAEGLPGHVEEDAHVLGLLVLEELTEHRREPVRGVRGQAPTGGQAANGVIGPVELAAAVHQVQRVLAAGH